MTMLAAILEAAGLRTAALGNIGDPAGATPPTARLTTCIAVELSSFQLHWSPRSPRTAGAAAQPRRRPPRLARRLRRLRRGQGAPSGAAAPKARRQPRRPARRGRSRKHAGRRVPGSPSTTPNPAAVGVVEDILVDCTGAERVHDLAPWPTSRPAGCAQRRQRARRRRARAPGRGRRTRRSATACAGTCPSRTATRRRHRRRRHLGRRQQGHQPARRRRRRCWRTTRIVWVAGGQLKGVDIDDLVGPVRHRLRRRRAARRGPGADRPTRWRDTRRTSPWWSVDGTR